MLSPLTPPNNKSIALRSTPATSHTAHAPVPCPHANQRSGRLSQYIIQDVKTLVEKLKSREKSLRWKTWNQLLRQPTVSKQIEEIVTLAEQLHQLPVNIYRAGLGFYDFQLPYVRRTSNFGDIHTEPSSYRWSMSFPGNLFSPRKPTLSVLKEIKKYLDSTIPKVKDALSRSNYKYNPPKEVITTTFPPLPSFTTAQGTPEERLQHLLKNLRQSS
jgi:hypothetical protein